MNSFSMVLSSLTIIILLANPFNAFALPPEKVEHRDLNPLRIYTIHGMDIQGDSFPTGTRYPLIRHSPDRKGDILDEGYVED